MRDNNKEYDSEREEELFLDKLPSGSDNKKAKPHIVRRNVEDYLEKKALERRLKDVFDENF
ncbi:MAG: hypothetical protein KJ914_09345 [Gammaproteobacteria bacterium]|nr:hypothetical protein [Gammaproteobacteria bacterium]MBU1723616.1 hypothetical protein [Gammaproteobacteria bacterium]MBU2004271.1 hypothetical protein [Gammaproteobacteria bacterium]